MFCYRHSTIQFWPLPIFFIDVQSKFIHYMTRICCLYVIRVKTGKLIKIHEYFNIFYGKRRLQNIFALIEIACV